MTSRRKRNLILLAKWACYFLILLIAATLQSLPGFLSIFGVRPLFILPVCLAVAIYSKVRLLKENWLPILVGCVVGSLVSMGSVLGLCRLFRLDEAMTASLLPKSVTTPIAVSVSQAHGGIPSITVVAVILTGIMGSILAPMLIRLFRVKDPITAGLAIGACSHAVGTSKALELGETEGAMSGLAIGVCGLVTVIFSLILM